MPAVEFLHGFAGRGGTAAFGLRSPKDGGPLRTIRASDLDQSGQLRTVRLRQHSTQASDRSTQRQSPS